MLRLFVLMRMTVHFAGWIPAPQFSWLQQVCQGANLHHRGSPYLRTCVCSLGSMQLCPNQTTSQKLSSANKRNVEVETTSGKSLMYTRNNSGPNTVPCSPPESTSSVADSHPSTSTCCVLEGKKSVIHCSQQNALSSALAQTDATSQTHTNIYMDTN
jgi:hypothetical protein